MRVLVMLVSGLLFVLVSAPNLAPAIAAARADGTPGVFTADRLSCVSHPGHEACTWYGTFRPNRGAPRRTSLYGSGRDTVAAGQRIRAFDVGRPGRVYGSGGSNEWILTSLLLVAGAGLVCGAAATAWRRRGALTPVGRRRPAQPRSRPA
jgi:hypothetical protein